jgi:hypothetical protein
MEVSGQLHPPAALSLKKESQIHIGYETGWVPELVGCSYEGNNGTPAGIQIRTFQPNTFAMATELSRFM